jgi:hypothetical protein
MGIKFKYNVAIFMKKKMELPLSEELEIWYELRKVYQRDWFHHQGCWFNGLRKILKWSGHVLGSEEEKECKDFLWQA